MNKELERLKEILSHTNPLSADYATILQRIETVSRLSNYVPVRTGPVFSATPLKSDYIPTTYLADEEATEEAPTDNPKPEENTEEPVKEEKPKEEPEKKKKAKKSALTSEEVRALIANASANGIVIKPIIQKFVPDGKPIKFSSIPQDAYAELVKEIENAG